MIAADKPLRIPESQWKLGRPEHFKYANEQLHKAIEADPALGKSLGKEIVEHVKPGARGKYSSESPPGWTWHHNAQNPELLELVPRPQHRAPGPVQESLHPNQGGGFKKLQEGE